MVFLLYRYSVHKILRRVALSGWFSVLYTRELIPTRCCYIVRSLPTQKASAVPTNCYPPLSRELKVPVFLYCCSPFWRPPSLSQTLIFIILEAFLLESGSLFPIPMGQTHFNVPSHLLYPTWMTSSYSNDTPLFLCLWYDWGEISHLSHLRNMTQSTQSPNFENLFCSNDDLDFLYRRFFKFLLSFFLKSSLCISLMLALLIWQFYFGHGLVCLQG